MAYPLSDEAQCAIGAAHKVERAFTRPEPTRSPTARGSAPSLDTRAGLDHGTTALDADTKRTHRLQRGGLRAVTPHPLR